MAHGSVELRSIISDLLAGDARVRARGLIALRHVSPEVIFGLLGHAEPQIRTMAASQLANPEYSFAVGALMHLLQEDCDETVRLAAAVTLRAIGDIAALLGHRSALKDTSEKVVVIACSALSEFSDKESIPAIVELLDAESWHVRFHACISLLMLGHNDSQILAVLERLAQTTEAEEHNRMAQAVRETEPKLPRVQVLQHNDLAARSLHEILTYARSVL